MPDVPHAVLGRAPVVSVLLRRILIVLEASWRPHFDTVQDSRPLLGKVEASGSKTLASSQVGSLALEGKRLALSRLLFS